MKKGELEGKATLWHENGQKKSEENFTNGKGEGKWTSWHGNGQKEFEANFKNGKKEGKWVYWDETGKKIKEEINPGIFCDVNIIQAEEYDLIGERC